MLQVTPVVQLLVRLVAPRDRVDDVLQAMLAVMRPAQLDRACHAVSLLRGADNARVIEYAEEWPASTDFDRQMCSDRVGRLLVLLDLAEQPPTIEVRTFERMDGLTYIARAREADARHASGEGDRNP